MPKRVLRGRVVANSLHKTITVLVERQFMHPVYKKFVKRTKRYHAHDEDNAAQVGDYVSIVETAPMSKTKTWRLIPPAAEAQAAEIADAPASAD